MKDFNHLFETIFSEMYNSEKQIAKAVPGLIQAAHDPKLKEALKGHLKETEEQAKRLEVLAAELDIELNIEPNTVMQALLQKGQKCAELNCSTDVKDAAIIAAVQCVEHYEIAIYGTLKAFARRLNYDTVEKKFDESLKEESKSDKKLSELAEGTLFHKGVNKKAIEKE